MQDNQLISVIVPVYNSEKYIESCIDSIIAQSYNNFELLLINDGSTDNSLKICLEKAKTDNRITVILKENGGASSARNAGLDKITGDYVVFADADDTVSPDYLKNLYLSAKYGGYDIVKCNLEVTHELNPLIKPCEFSPEHITEITKVEALNERKFKVSPCATIYADHLFENNRFTEGIIYEDDDSYYRFAYEANKLALLNENLYFYYMSQNSVMRNNSIDKKTDFIEIYERRIKYFADRNEAELLDGSYNRYCLVLMLFIASSRAKKHNLKDIDRLWELYKEKYKRIKNSPYVPLKDKCMYTCFRAFPKISGFFICKIRG